MKNDQQANVFLNTLIEKFSKTNDNKTWADRIKQIIQQIPFMIDAKKELFLQNGQTRFILFVILDLIELGDEFLFNKWLCFLKQFKETHINFQTPINL